MTRFKDILQTTPENIQIRSKVITPDMLLRDNNSGQVEVAIAQIEFEKDAGIIIVQEGCSDARTEGLLSTSKPGIITVPTISAAGLVESGYIYRHPSVKFVVSIQHTDLVGVTADVEPKGCGGRLVKGERLKNGGNKAEKGVMHYVDHRIKSPHMLVQAVAAASQVAVLTDRPVVAMIEDHRTLRLYPVAMLTENGRTIKYSVPFGRLGQWDYVYQNGYIPELPQNDIPLSISDMLLSLLEENREIAALQTPEFIESQEVQNPHTVVISSSKYDIGKRYPSYFSDPNTCFKIFLEYSKDASGEITDFSPQGFIKVIQQAEYPIFHATHAQPGDSFYETNTILIETNNMRASELVAMGLIHTNWCREWLLSSSKRQILLAELDRRTGKTRDIIVYEVNLDNLLSRV